MEFTPKKIECFKTSDGDIFESLNSAELHQQEIEKAELADKLLQEGKSIADILKAVKYNGEIDPTLNHVTKDTKLIISHWQCRDNPEYSPLWFESGMRLMVGGNAGSWSGPYRNYVTLHNLVRYAQITFKKEERK